MGRHFWQALVGLGIAITGTGLGACTIVTLAGPVPDLSTGDASATLDGGRDGAAEAEAAADEEPPPSTCNAQSCGGACCGGRCVSQTCHGCDAGTHFCPFKAGDTASNGFCVAQCSSCQSGSTTLGTTCFDCSSGDPVPTCVTSADQCPATSRAGACSCPSHNSGDCPGPTQVCQSSDGGDPICITP